MRETSIAATRAQPPAEGMTWIPGGFFRMGSNDHYPEEAPAHGVEVDGFWIDTFEITNPAIQPVRREDRLSHRRRAATRPGADWRHPEGPASSLAGRDDHAVVQVAHEDAQPYASWTGKVLPTEAEWDLAARGRRLEAVVPALARPRATPRCAPDSTLSH